MNGGVGIVELKLADAHHHPEAQAGPAGGVVEAQLPALLTVTASIAEPRYPSFKGVMAAKRKPIDERDLAALGLEAGTVGAAGAAERVLAVEEVREENQGQMVTDDGAGSSVEAIVAFLERIQVV